MVVSRFTGNTLDADNTLSVITPDGQVQTQEFDAKTGSTKKVAGALDQMHLNETKKLNELRQLGWRVVTSTQMSVGGGVINEMVYLLEK